MSLLLGIVACEKGDSSPRGFTNIGEFQSETQCVEPNQGLVFARAPTLINYKTERVQLPGLIADGSGTLKSNRVVVYGCPKDLPRQRDTSYGTCTPEPTALADAEGCFAQYSAPINLTNNDDPFAEVNAYYHLQRAYGHFESLGYSPAQSPIHTVVNWQFRSHGINWAPFGNAFYLEPGDEWAELFPGIDNQAGMLVFGQGAKDFAYDNVVIYHEFGHSVIGPDRFNYFGADEFGPDHTPPAAHEGIADVFANILDDQPIVGAYALPEIFRRDLSEFARCPDDIEGEPHKDGQILSSAIWRLHNELEPHVAMDQVTLDALISLTSDSGFPEIADALVQTLKESHGDDIAESAREILGEHGLDQCARTRPLENFEAGLYTASVLVPGMLTSGLLQFPGGIPSPIQFHYTGSASAGTLSLDLEVFDAQVPMDESPTHFSAAWRTGEPISYTYDPFAVQTADGLLEPSKVAEDRYKMSLNIPCPNREVYIQFINHGPASIYVRKLTTTFEPTIEEPNADCSL